MTLKRAASSSARNRRAAVGRAVRGGATSAAEAVLTEERRIGAVALAAWRRESEPKFGALAPALSRSPPDGGAMHLYIGKRRTSSAQG
jgi:hypothetical protein